MWSRRRLLCRTCNRQLEPGEFTCGEQTCEMAALSGQAMLAPAIFEQEVRTARRVRFQAPALLPNLEPC